MEDAYRSQFRLPYPLYEQLKESAGKSNRSLNAEIVQRLEDSYSIADPDMVHISVEKLGKVIQDAASAAIKDYQKVLQEYEDKLKKASQEQGVTAKILLGEADGKSKK